MPPTPFPTDERLRDTIAQRMRHNDQPLMLMEHLSRRSPAQDVARRILGEDVTQIEVYAGPNGLDVFRIVAVEAFGLALMATRFSRRRWGGCQTGHVLENT